MGPSEDVSYPLNVIYCGNCSLPLEYCEYNQDHDKCKAWLEKNLPDEFQRIVGTGGDAGEDGQATDEKIRQKRGGEGVGGARRAEEAAARRIQVWRAARGRRKCVTVISGLGTCKVDLRAAAKMFGTRFACGASVTGDDEIVVQGDVKDDLIELIPEKWPDIDPDLIEDLGDLKR
uniref:Putative carbonic anhydrase 6 n=1 Tax=Panstrongylus lignarius TaxID=156445 RepID=A0A224XY86_9HEMI